MLCTFVLRSNNWQMVNTSEWTVLCTYILLMSNHWQMIKVRGSATPKILHKIVQSLKFGEDCKIVTTDCNLT